MVVLKVRAEWDWERFSLVSQIRERIRLCAWIRQMISAGLGVTGGTNCCDTKAGKG